MRQIRTKFFSFKIDDGADPMMSSDAIYYSDIFVQYLYRQVQFLFFISFAQLFFHRQNALECVRTVNIPTVTTCFMIPSFRMLMKITCSIYFNNVTNNCIHIRLFDNFFRIWLNFHHQALIREQQFLKHVKYVHSINQLHLIWLLNVR